MRCWFCLLTSFFLFACEPDTVGSPKLDTGTAMTPQLFTIKLGIKPDEYLKMNNLDSQQNVDRQPAGVNFYEKHWPSDNRGTVFVDHGRYSFQLKNILHATGIESVREAELGITQFNLNGGGAPQSLDFHDAIRQRFLVFLKELEGKGWESYVYLNSPRLSPESAIRYILEVDDFHTIPIGYPIKLEQWMRFKYANWRLHANGVFLDISFSRDAKLMNPTEYGSYLFSYEIYDKETMGAGHMESIDRPRWKELWVAKAKELKKIRYETEAELMKKGYTIDTSYVDPIIHPADPVEP